MKATSRAFFREKPCRKCGTNLFYPGQNGAKCVACSKDYTSRSKHRETANPAKHNADAPVFAFGLNQKWITKELRHGALFSYYSNPNQSTNQNEVTQ